MSQHVSPTPVQDVEAAPSHVAARPSSWTAARITVVVVGALLVLASVGLLGAGGVGVWAETQRDGDYVTTGVHHFSTSGSALATEKVELGSAGVAWLYPPAVIGKIRIRVTPENSSAPVFVGIAHTSDVDTYLAGVNHTVITDFFGEKTEATPGGPAPSAPTTQHFWAASVTGARAQTLLWKPADGSWSVVVMNADGHPGIGIGSDLGARMPNLLWITIGLLAAGAILLIGGVLLIVGAVRRRV